MVVQSGVHESNTAGSGEKSKHGVQNGRESKDLKK